MEENVEELATDLPDVSKTPLGSLKLSPGGMKILDRVVETKQASVPVAAFQSSV